MPYNNEFDGNWINQRIEENDSQIGLKVDDGRVLHKESENTYTGSIARHGKNTTRLKVEKKNGNKTKEEEKKIHCTA